MKFRELHLGKAISAALFVLLLTVAGTKNALAQTQVATLQHGQEITAFYGSSALVQAHQAAESGDIITLSSGTFTGVNIDKAITLRGAGCVADTEAGTVPTVIANDFDIAVADTLGNHLTIEGIYFPNKIRLGNMANSTFTRCNFWKIDWQWYTSQTDSQFVDCFIDNFYFDCAYDVVLYNCVVWNPSNIAYNRRVTAYNSIIGRVGSTITGLSAYNSIIIRDGGNTPSDGCTFFNCIGINIEEHDPFGSGNTQNCVTYTSYGDVFTSFEGEFTFMEEFLLNEDAQNFETTDGTEVGIYGGVMPYSSIPFYMVRKRTTVSSRSNVDGTLNVEIEILNEEEGE